MVKVVKLQIVKPLNIEWKVLGEILNNVSHEQWKIKNACVNHMHAISGYSQLNYTLDNKFKLSAETKKELLGGKYKSEAGYVYDKVKELSVIGASSNVASMSSEVCAKYTKDYKLFLRGERAISGYKHNKSIYLKNASVKKVDKDLATGYYYVTLNLLSNKGKEQYGFKTGDVSVSIKVSDAYQQAIVDRCISGEYGMSASKIQRKDGKWMLYLSYNFETEKKVELDKDKILGVDMGIIYPVHCAVGGSRTVRSIEGGEIENFRRKVERHHKVQQRRDNIPAESATGSGRNRKMKRTDTIGKKVVNFRDYINHKYAKQVVEWAVYNKCGTIQMEELTGIGELSAFLKKWSYYDLQNKITVKALACGIDVKKIEPRYTSQRCNECGHIDRDNRKKQSQFECVKCGHKANADANAARNIAIKDIDRIIDDWVLTHGDDK